LNYEGRKSLIFEKSMYNIFYDKKTKESR